MRVPQPVSMAAGPAFAAVFWAAPSMLLTALLGGGGNDSSDPSGDQNPPDANVHVGLLESRVDPQESANFGVEMEGHGNEQRAVHRRRCVDRAVGCADLCQRAVERFRSDRHWDSSEGRLPGR